MVLTCTLLCFFHLLHWDTVPCEWWSLPALFSVVVFSSSPLRHCSLWVMVLTCTVLCFFHHVHWDTVPCEWWSLTAQFSVFSFISTETLFPVSDGPFLHSSLFFFIFSFETLFPVSDDPYLHRSLFFFFHLLLWDTVPCECWSLPAQFSVFFFIISTETLFPVSDSPYLHSSLFFFVISIETLFPVNDVLTCTVLCFFSSSPLRHCSLVVMVLTCTVLCFFHLLHGDTVPCEWWSLPAQFSVFFLSSSRLRHCSLWVMVLTCTVLCFFLPHWDTVPCEWWSLPAQFSVFFIFSTETLFHVSDGHYLQFSVFSSSPLRHCSLWVMVLTCTVLWFFHLLHWDTVPCEWWSLPAQFSVFFIVSIETLFPVSDGPYLHISLVFHLLHWDTVPCHHTCPRKQYTCPYHMQPRNNTLYHSCPAGYLYCLYIYTVVGVSEVKWLSSSLGENIYSCIPDKEIRCFRLG